MQRLEANAREDTKVDEHKWSLTDNGWQCAKCLEQWPGSTPQAGLPDAGCKHQQIPAALKRIISKPGSHSLKLANTIGVSIASRGPLVDQRQKKGSRAIRLPSSSTLLFCQKCGAYATKVPKKLKGSVLTCHMYPSQANLGDRLCLISTTNLRIQIGQMQP